MLTALVAIAVLVGGTAVAVVLINRHGATSSRAAQARPAAITGGVATEDQLLTAIRTEGLTPTRAEELFALDVGPLPGVSVRGIKPDGAFDGTTALLYLYGEWTHLTKAQQDAATRLVTSSHVERTGPIATTASETDRPPSAAGWPASEPSPGSKAPLAAQLTGQPLFNYAALAGQADATEAIDSTAPPIPALVIDVSEDTSAAFAVTSMYYKNGQGQWKQFSDGCHITVFDPIFQGLSSDDAAAVIAHEVWHCFQNRQAGSGPNAEGLHPWIGEGEATWVENELYPNNTILRDTQIWLYYTVSPLKKFDDRRDDGVGVFGHEGDVAPGGQEAVWTDLLPVVSAGLGGQDSAALKRLMESGSELFYSSWGASYFADQQHVDWYMGGPGKPPSNSSPQTVTINNDDAHEIGLYGPYQAHQVSIDSSADILTINLTSGYGKVHDSAYKVDRTLDTSAPLALCLKQGGCTCPDGSPGASEHTIPATSPISIGLDGGDQSLAAYASGDPLSKFCKQPDQPPPPGGPPPQAGGGGGGGGGGGEPEPPPPAPPAQSAGDPHLLTFDHHWYDLQAVGEFTLVKSTVDDFIVQARTAPLPGSTTIAVNVAVATTLGGHRLTLTAENGTIIARVDGVINGHEVFSVGAGTVQRLGTEVGAGYMVEWPDTTRMRVDQMGVVGLNVSIWPAPSRAGKLVGLLGSDNGQASEDFVTANGANLGATPPPATIHGQFADSWRLTQAASLFDYGPGQSTATFTDRTFPHAYVDATSIPNAAKAMQACMGEGITDKGILADCIIDDAALNNQSVLTHYAQAQVVLTVATNFANNLPPFGGLSGGPSPSPSPSGSEQGVLVDSGAVTNAGEDQVFTFPANAGDIIWFGSPGCDNGGLAFALLDPQGRTLNANSLNAAQGVLCQDTRFALTTSGRYELIANADKSRTGGYSVPIRFERHDQVFQTSYGQAISGNIPDPATHDVYVFTAQLGDVVHISGAGCNVAAFGSVQQSSPIYVSLDDSAGKGIIGLDCTQNSSYSIQGTATYEIVVNEPEHGPGAYQFVIQK